MNRGATGTSTNSQDYMIRGAFMARCEHQSLTTGRFRCHKKGERVRLALAFRKLNSQQSRERYGDLETNFALFDWTTKERIKDKVMTHLQACELNKALEGSGYAWAKCYPIPTRRYAPPLPQKKSDTSKQTIPPLGWHEPKMMVIGFLKSKSSASGERPERMVVEYKRNWEEEHPRLAARINSDRSWRCAGTWEKGKGRGIWRTVPVYSVESILERQPVAELEPVV